MRECIKPIRINYRQGITQPAMIHQPFPDMSPETLLERLRSAPIGNLRVHPNCSQVLMWMPLTDSGYRIDFTVPSDLALAVFLRMLRDDIDKNPRARPAFTGSLPTE